MNRFFLKILIVDDVQINRMLYKEMLEGLAVMDEAEDGFKAWDLYIRSLTRSRYDVILLDIAMPRVDGIELLTLIREYEVYHNQPAVPVLVITAHKEKIAEANIAGYDDYLLKPVVYESLYAKIIALTSSKRNPPF